MRRCNARHIPTHAQEVFDVSGAGDTVIAVLTTSFSGSLKGTYAMNREELKEVLCELSRKEV